MNLQILYNTVQGRNFHIIQGLTIRLSNQQTLKQASECWKDFGQSCINISYPSYLSLFAYSFNQKKDFEYLLTVKTEKSYIIVLVVKINLLNYFYPLFGMIIQLLLDCGK